MGEDDIGVPTPNTPNWWLTTEQLKKYRGPNNWKRNWEEYQQKRDKRRKT